MITCSTWHSVGTGEWGRRRRGHCHPRLPATTTETKSPGTVFLTRAGVASSPRSCGLRGTELGPRSRGERHQVGRSLAPQLGALTAGTAPTGQPLPPLTEPLPAVRRSRRDRAGKRPRPGDARIPQEVPPNARPPAGLSRPPPPLPLHSGTQAAHGGRGEGAGVGGKRAEETRRARRGPSAERSPLQLQPQVPSLLPVPQTRRRQLRKEEPVLQRHSAILTARRQQEEAGSRSPGAEQPTDPAPSESSLYLSLT